MLVRYSVPFAIITTILVNSILATYIYPNGCGGSSQKSNCGSVPRKVLVNPCTAGYIGCRGYEAKCNPCSPERKKIYITQDKIYGKKELSILDKLANEIRAVRKPSILDILLNSNGYGKNPTKSSDFGIIPKKWPKSFNNEVGDVLRNHKATAGDTIKPRVPDSGLETLLKAHKWTTTTNKPSPINPNTVGRHRTKPPRIAFGSTAADDIYLKVELPKDFFLSKGPTTATSIPHITRPVKSPANSRVSSATEGIKTSTGRVGGEGELQAPEYTGGQEPSGIPKVIKSQVFATSYDQSYLNRNKGEVSGKKSSNLEDIDEPIIVKASDKSGGTINNYKLVYKPAKAEKSQDKKGFEGFRKDGGEVVSTVSNIIMRMDVDGVITKVETSRSQNSPPPDYDQSVPSNSLGGEDGSPIDA